MNRPAPVPLFNYKKRQRQALVSDPGKLLTGSISQSDLSEEKQETCYSGTSSFTPNGINKTSSPNASKANIHTIQSNKVSTDKFAQGLMDMTGKFNSNSGGNRIASIPSTKQESSNIRGRHSTNSASFPGQSFSSSFADSNRGRGFANLPRSSRGAGQTTVPQGRGQLKFNDISSPIHRSRQATGNSFNTRNDPIGSKNTDNGYFQGGNAASGSRQQYFSGVSAGKKDAFQPSFESKMSFRSSTLSSKAAGVSMRPANKKAPLNSNNSSNFPGRPTQFPSRGSCFTAGNSFLQSDFDFDDENIFDVRQKKPSHTQSVPKRNTEKPVVDTSMRIFTCPISLLKSWVGFKVYNGPVMFEVYGLLDSATVKDNTGNGKEFVLRDDTDSIKCVFYEIDRELPRLTRGQVHRVVGVADKKRGLLQVMCVRPAHKEERVLCQTACALSQTEMEQLAGLNSEQ